MTVKYTTATGERLDDMGKLDMLFHEISRIIGCNAICESRCVFPEVGSGVGCPLNQFRDSVDYACGLKEEA